MLTSLIAITIAFAANGHVPVAGALTDADGTPADGARTVDVWLYADGTTATELHYERQTVVFERGAFALSLGVAQPLDLDPFATNPTVHVAIGLAGDTPAAPVPILPVPYAVQAQRVGGLAAADLVTWASGYLGGHGLNLSGDTFDVVDGELTPEWTNILNRPDFGALALATTIVNADVAANAGIATSKLAGPVTDIAGNGLGALATKSSISNADVALGAAIAGSKIDPNFGAQNIVNVGRLGVGHTRTSPLAGLDLRVPTGTNLGLRIESTADNNRHLGLYTSDFTAGTTGSSLRIQQNASTGNTASTIQAYQAGEASNGTLLLNAAGGSVGVATSSPKGASTWVATGSAAPRPT